MIYRYLLLLLSDRYALDIFQVLMFSNIISIRSVFKSLLCYTSRVYFEALNYQKCMEESYELEILHVST